MSDIPKLWEHQAVDIKRYLENPNLLNTSDPGTGKTRVIIEVIRRMNIPVLILAPKSILSCAWQQDIKKFAPELQSVIANANNRRKAFENPARVVITNHDAVTWLLQKDNADLLLRFRGGILVIDESTCYKNPTAKRSKSASKLRDIFAYCTCMSGTPTPQGIIDIWHQMYLIDRGQMLGNSYYRFRANTYTPTNKGPFTTWEEKEGVADAIADIISPITIRNLKETCMDIPPNHIITRVFDLSPANMKVYQELKRKAIVAVQSGTITAMNAAVLGNKLLQIASGAVYDENKVAHIISTERNELVMDLVEEREHSVVAFTWKHQRDELIKIAQHRGYSYALIDGTVSNMYERTNIVNAYQDGKYKVLFIHPKSAGHGITITKGTATIWPSPTYNCEFFIQANARIDRGGQTLPTETILIAANNTIDIQAYEALQSKVFNMKNLLEILE